MPWHVIVTRTSAEHRAEKHLERAGFDVWLPVHIPLPADGAVLPPRPRYPGYLFAQFDADRDDWPSILTTAHVLSLLVDRRGRPMAVPDAVIDAVRAAVDAEMTAPRPSTPDWTADVGRYLTILAGPFAGVVGQCVEADRRGVTLQVGPLPLRVARRWLRRPRDAA